MPEWTVCPHCQLKHTRRPDGACPRCKQAVDGAAAAPDAAAVAEPSAGMPSVYDGRAFQASPSQINAATPDEDVPLGAKIAGGVMMLNGLVLFLQKVMGRVTAGDVPYETGRMGGIGLGIILGGLIVSGNAKAATVVKWLVSVVGSIGVLVLFATGQATLAFITLLYVAGLLLLLIGNAGPARIGIGGVALALFLSVGVMGLSRHNPMARLLMAGQIESDPALTVEGVSVRYRLAAPNGKWYLRKAEVAKKDNASADRWLVRPGSEAHIVVVAETLPGTMRVDMEKMEQFLLEHHRKNSQDFLLVERLPIATRMQQARLLHTRCTIKGIKTEWLHGLFVQDQYVFTVAAFSEARRFAELSDEMTAVVSSLQFP
jgi:energy-converting hydrogenase Eha subunit E